MSKPTGAGRRGFIKTITAGAAAAYDTAIALAGNASERDAMLRRRPLVGSDD